MTNEDNNNQRKHGSAIGAAWIVIGIVFAFLVVSAISWSGHNSSDTVSAANSRETTGSDTPSTGGR